MELLVISPEGELLRNDSVTSVELPGSKGRFVVLKDHAPLITSLTGGFIRWSREGQEDGALEIKSGFAKVYRNTITVCVG